MVIATDDLEVACPHCERAGEIEGKPCPACSGKGVILTRKYASGFYPKTYEQVKEKS